MSLVSNLGHLRRESLYSPLLTRHEHHKEEVQCLPFSLSLLPLSASHTHTHTHTHSFDKKFDVVYYDQLAQQEAPFRLTIDPQASLPPPKDKVRQWIHLSHTHTHTLARAGPCAACGPLHSHKVEGGICQLEWL